MKRLLAIALVLTASAVPVCAQRSGGRGGFSGSRGAPSFRGGSGSPSHFTGSFASRAPIGTAREARPSFYPANRFQNRYPVGRPVRRGIPFRNFAYGYPSGVSYAGYPYLDAPFYDDGFYGDDPGYASESPIPYVSSSPDPTAYGYTQSPVQPPYETEFQTPAEIDRPAPRSEPEPAAVTTLIFNDARPPQKIRNYIATRSTITVIDGPRHHDIPVDDLNIPATIQANRDTGIGFQLPAAR